MSEWEVKLFGCFETPNLCVLAFFAPCVLIGRTSEVLGEDCMKIALLQCFCNCPYGIIIREKVRQQKGYEEDMTMALVKQIFCFCCVAVQNARELGLGNSPGEEASMSRE